MPAKSSKMESIEELFEHELKDIYDAEKKLVRATASMAKKVTDEELSRALTEHSEVTQVQVERLESVFEQLGKKPQRTPCKGINGLIEEFTSFVKEEKPGPEVLNLFATGAASKVEQYEIESYKSLIDLAKKIGENQLVELFEASLQEEEETAELLEGMSKKVLIQAA